MASEENGTKVEVLDELGSSFLETEECGNGTFDNTSETNPSQTVSQTDNTVNSVKAEEGGENSVTQDEAEGQEDEEVEGDEILLDADAEAPDAEENVEDEKDASSAEKEPLSDSKKDATKKKEDQEEEEDAEESEEADKKMAEKFDPNQMPQVNVATLASKKLLSVCRFQNIAPLLY